MLYFGVLLSQATAQAQVDRSKGEELDRAHLRESPLSLRERGLGVRVKSSETRLAVAFPCPFVAKSIHWIDLATKPVQERGLDTENTPQCAFPTRAPAGFRTPTAPNRRE